eukprot:17418-Amphidinium_carterae.2
MCQVLVLQRDKLLECLRKYPGESTKMVIEQSRRVSAATRGSWKAAQVRFAVCVRQFVGLLPLLVIGDMILALRREKRKKRDKEACSDMCSNTAYVRFHQSQR